ncbi:MAG TPA: alpha/beta fold hydrolase [Gemmatimonadaceae bacterium]|nr:alpha/beta fold hydrolase [Gemmatimonadaceae bacterium]
MRGEFVDLAGARLYYYAAGTRGAGEPVVFVHGLPTSSHLWRDVVPHMPGGHRMVVMDLLGFGRSDRPNGADLSIRGHAERTIALLDALRIERAAIVGHDVGGGIAQYLAVRFPTRVSRLALIDAVAFDDWPTRDVKLAKASLPLTRYLPATWILTILRTDLLRGYVDRERGEHSLEQYVRPFITPEGRDVFVEHLLALTASDTVALAPRLEHIVAPTAIIWGAHDPFLDVSTARRLHESIPGSTLDVIPDARHFTPEESPETIASMLTEWLAR